VNMTYEEASNFLTWMYKLERAQCLSITRQTAPLREVIWFMFLAYYGTDAGWCDG